MERISVVILIWAFVIVVVLGDAANSNQHSARDTHKAQIGWQEPGLWRPKWIMDRTFIPTEENGQPTKDRVHLRLKNDRTVKIYNQRSRPLLEWRKKRIQKRTTKKLFETDEDTDNESSTVAKEEDFDRNMPSSSPEEEGTWWWKDMAPLKQGNVKVELRDGDAPDTYLVHETYCDWGKLDPYVAKFRKGKIMRYRRNESGLPGKSEEVGSFIIKSSTHRPLVSKDFIAFQ
jgi:hypothetical protein